jgi:dolichol-phosphate mannosyltransferase
MKSIAVVPTYNEAENIERFVHQVLQVQPSFNILIVDDNSPDGTWGRT